VASFLQRCLEPPLSFPSPHALQDPYRSGQR
jgi:hypothetical protein